VTFSGEFMNYMSGNFTDPASGAFPKVELNMAAAVDDFNTVKLEIDSEGGIGPAAVDDFRLVTEIGAALGLPVDVTATFGFFDTYFTGWYYYEGSGWTWYYPWDNGIVEQGPNTNGAMQLDIGFGPATFHWYNDFAAQNFMVGLDAEFAGLTAWVAYGDTFQAVGEGELSVEAAYNLVMGDIDGNASGFFRYNLGTEAFTYGVNLGVDVSMFHVGAGLEGDDVDTLDNVVAEVKVTPMDPLTIHAGLLADLAATDPLCGVDIGLSYMVGAAKLSLGYVIDTDNGVTANIIVPSGDNYTVQDGLYLGVDIDY
jgi:hypothetical protein